MNDTVYGPTIAEKQHLKFPIPDTACYSKIIFIFMYYLFAALFFLNFLVWVQILVTILYAQRVFMIIVNANGRKLVPEFVQ